MTPRTYTPSETNSPHINGGLSLSISSGIDSDRGTLAIALQSLQGRETMPERFAFLFRLNSAMVTRFCLDADQLLDSGTRNEWNEFLAAWRLFAATTNLKSEQEIDDDVQEVVADPDDVAPAFVIDYSALRRTL